MRSFCMTEETLAKCKCPLRILNQEKNDLENAKESKLKPQNNTSLILLAKQISLQLTQYICQTPPLILNLKPEGKNSARVQAHAFMLLTKPYPCNFKARYCNPKP